MIEELSQSELEERRRDGWLYNLHRVTGDDADSRECLADFLIELHETLTEKEDGARLAAEELQGYIRVLFEQSDAYKKALHVYQKRYKLVGASSPEEVFDDAIEKYITRAEKPASNLRH